jgi:transcriptional regulator with XRE-family HTH domain
LGLSVTDGAKALGVTRQALNNLVNGKSGISPEMAIRLEKARLTVLLKDSLQRRGPHIERRAQGPAQSLFGFLGSILFVI